MTEKKPRKTTKPKRRSLPAQSAFLDRVIEEHLPVEIFLRTGDRVSGKIESYDHFVVALKAASAEKVYKHAISFIRPLDKDAPPVAVKRTGARTAPTVEVKRRRRVVVAE